MKQFRQGDVLLIQVNDIPKNAQKVTEKIIAHGESSNHCHRVTNNVEVMECNGETYLQVNDEGSLEHVLVSNPTTWTKEHYPIKLEKGYYKVIKQVEYDPYEDHIRNVID